MAALSVACAPQTKPSEFFTLSEESPANRAMQTRHFETRDSDELLSASAAAFQDLGFQIEESVRDLGFLRAFPADHPWHLVVNFTGPHNPMDVYPIGLHVESSLH